MNLDDLTVSEFIVEKWDYFQPVYLKRAEQRDGSVKWKITEGRSSVMNKDGDFLVEPIPSSRDQNYLNMTRFEIKEEALRAYKQKARPKLKEQEDLRKRISPN